MSAHDDVTITVENRRKPVESGAYVIEGTLPQGLRGGSPGGIKDQRGRRCTGKSGRYVEGGREAAGGLKVVLDRGSPLKRVDRQVGTASAC